MRYPIAIEAGDEFHAFGVVVPDLTGCFSAGDTLNEAIDNSREAIELWLETVIEDGGTVPDASPIDRWRLDPQYADWIWAVVEVDVSKLDDKAERINITLPRSLLSRIDRHTRTSHESRSGFLARAAVRELARELEMGSI
ncbi:MAG: type II toxin-antitoxin system HicB family antitoxin [Methylococcales bacterium]